MTDYVSNLQAQYDDCVDEIKRTVAKHKAAMLPVIDCIKQIETAGLIDHVSVSLSDDYTPTWSVHLQECPHPVSVTCTLKGSIGSKISVSVDDQPYDHPNRSGTSEDFFKQETITDILQKIAKLKAGSIQIEW